MKETYAEAMRQKKKDIVSGENFVQVCISCQCVCVCVCVFVIHFLSFFLSEAVTLTRDESEFYKQQRTWLGVEQQNLKLMKRQIERIEDRGFTLKAAVSPFFFL